VCRYGAPSGYSGRDIEIGLQVGINGAAAPPVVNLRACGGSDILCEVPLLDTDVTPGSVTVSLRGGPQGFRGSFLIEEAMVDG
jgi:hypothetical protein